MKLVEYNSEFKKRLIEFNIENYPNRSNIEQRIEFLLNCKCKKFSVKVFLGIDDDQIIGQIFLLPFFIKDTEEIHYWGMDYFVHNDYRNTPIGIMLLRKVLKKHAHLGMAFSPLSLKIHKVLGEKQIADLKLFIKPSFGIVTSLFNNKGLPETIKTKGQTFNRVDSISYVDTNMNHHIDLISRTTETLKWRLNPFDDRVYYKYLSSDKDAFVVLRKVTLKKVPMLLVVDYRLSSYNKEGLENINEVILKALRRTTCFGALFYNSIPDFDIHLKKMFYFKFKNIPVLSNRPLTNVLITPADSDFELNI